MSKDKIFLLIIISLSLLIFSPGLFNFFSSDDWYHLDISRISKPSEFANFFSISQTPQSIPFYRPLSTQVFFFIFQTIFGFNPLPYHIFIYSLFAVNLYLIYRLGLLILKDKYRSLISVFIYAFSATNFVRLYFISVAQEIMMLTFILLALFNYLKPSKVNNVYAFIFFMLAILCKETVIVLPLILLAYEVINKRLNVAKIAPYFLIILPYLYIRYHNLGEGVVSSYIFDFSVRKFFNTLSWYFLWSLGGPELLVDYVSSGFNILPRFYTDFPLWSKIILPFLGAILICFMILIFKNIRYLGKTFVFSLFIFIIGLFPVIFLPSHKFTLQLTLSMVGFSFLVGSLSKYRAYLAFFIISFAALNILTNLLTYQTHYSVARSRISQKVFYYFASNYHNPPKDTYFEFINDTPNFGKEWGSSKQISQAISGSDLFKVLYKDHNYHVYFEDDQEDKPSELKKISISTKEFLKY